MGDQASDLISLPDEVVLLICAHLDVKELGHLASVCNKLHMLVNDPVLWKQMFFKRKYTLPDNSDGHGLTYKGKPFRLLIEEKYQALQLWKKRENSLYYVIATLRRAGDVLLQFDTNKIVYGGSQASSVQVWTGPKQGGTIWCGHDVFRLNFHEDHLVTSTKNLNQQNVGIRLWKVPDWAAVRTNPPTLARTFPGEAAGVLYQAFNGNTLITGSESDDIHVYDVEAGKRTTTIKILQPQITAFHASFEDSGSVMTGGSDGTVLLYDLRTADVVKSFKNSSSQGIVTLQYDDNTLITATDRMLRRYEMASETCTNSVDITLRLSNSSDLESVLWNSPSLRCLQFDRHKLITGFSQGPLALWNTKDLSFVRAIEQGEPHRNMAEPATCALAFNEKVLIAVLSDNEWCSSLCAWKVYDKNERARTKN